MSDEVTRDIARGLDELFPNSSVSDNYTLLEPVGDYEATTDSDISSILDASRVRDATTIAQLEKLGKLVGVTYNDGETKEHFRARIRAEYALATSEGTIEDVLVSAAEIIETSPDSLVFAEPAGGENGTIELGLPGKAIDNVALTDTEVAEFLDRLIAASYRVDGYRVGTFTYITPTDYNNNNHDATKGYDGLDGNGDPKDNGGTYAGLIT